jgi:hypothetical protein
MGTTLTAAPHATQCCPASALRQLSPDELATLDAYCARALDDPEVGPIGDEEIAAVAAYHRTLARLAVGVWRRERRAQAHYGRRPVAP